MMVFLSEFIISCPSRANDGLFLSPAMIQPVNLNKVFFLHMTRYEARFYTKTQSCASCLSSGKWNRSSPSNEAFD
jgi:hypothetical protein